MGSTDQVRFSLADLQACGLRRYLSSLSVGRCGHFHAQVFQVRALIAGNGATQYKLYCMTCHRCISGAIAHKDLSDLVREHADQYPIRREHNWHPPCEHCGDDDSGVELHHWAPISVFDDAWRWPTSYLCRSCHRLWHQRMAEAVQHARGMMA